MLSYYLIVPILFFFAYLPSPVLYALAEAVAWFLRVVVRYRRQVVLTNLRNSFAQKSEQEINSIAADSYRHLAYRVVENIKCFTITPAEINKRMRADNFELLNHYQAQGRHVVLMVGHIASWEFGGYKLSMGCKHKVFGIVSLVSNPYFNKLVQDTRGKMGMKLIAMKDSKQFFKEPLTELSLGIFISDQSPSNPSKAYWTNFLNQQTAFFKGAESYARMHNCVVLYPKIVQTKRGHYSAEILVIEENPNSVVENVITEKFVRLLEQQILETPADWLWSHNRWKHKHAV